MRLNPETVAFIERGGRTLRCHTQPMLQSQTVAAHSYGVAWWCYLLAGEGCGADLIMAALAHDMAEHETGDVPSPTKEALGIRGLLDSYEERLMRGACLPIFDLEPDSKRILKLADSLELMQHCVRERQYGNRHDEIALMFNKVRRYADTLLQDAIDHEAFTIVVETWEKANER